MGFPLIDRLEARAGEALLFTAKTTPPAVG